MFKSINANPNIVIPLSAKYDYDSWTSLDPSKIVWSDGYTTFQHPIFKYSRDISFNKDSFFILTSSIDLKSSFAETFYNTVSTGGFTYFKFLSTDQFMVEDNGVLMASAVSSSDDGFFRLAINDDATISILKGSKYFTVDRSAPWTVRLSSLMDSDTFNQQKFDYNLYENVITIATRVNPIYNPNITYRRFLSYSPVSKQVRAVGTVYDDDYSYSNPYFIEMFLNSDFVMSLSTLPLESIWVRYYADLTNKLRNQTADINFSQSITSVKQNYLVDVPYATKVNLDDKSMSVNFMPLKTVKSPEYEYVTTPFLSGESLNNEASNSDKLKRREYNQIFTGSNESEGYENIFLSYNANTKQLSFEPDTVTYFHYPRTAPTMPLSASGLVEAGAIAGSCPFNSDKIWKKQANYEKYTEWGNASVQQGTWLCSWLSGSPSTTVKPVWKDRYYYAGYIDSSDAFVSSTSAYIYDTNSQMVFEQGVYYKYHHIGHDINASFINTLSGADARLCLHLNDWSENTKDLSTYENVVTLEGFSSDMISPTDISWDNISEDDTCIVLNGVDQDCRVSYSQTHLPSADFTASFWAYAEDWQNVKGHHLLSKSFRGGFDVKYNNGFYTPNLAVIDNRYGHLILLNNEGKFYKNVQLPVYNNSPCTPSLVMTDRDLFIWVGDNTSKNVYKVDYNGNILDTISFFSDGVETDIKSLVSDMSGNVTMGLSSTVGYDYRKYDPYTLSLITSGTISGPIIEYDLDGAMINLTPAYTNTKVQFDSSGNYYYLTDDGILIQKSGITEYILSPTPFSDFAVDESDSLYATRDNVIYRYSISDHTISPVSVSTLDGDYVSGGAFITLLYQNNNGKIAVIYEVTNKAYILDRFLNIEKVVFLNYAINAEKYRDFFRGLILKPLGDFSGYEWNKKYNFFKKGSKKTIDANLFLSNDDDYAEYRTTISYDASALSNFDWHHFAISFDRSNQLFKFYVDTVTVGESSLPDMPVFYRYKNPLFLGNNTSILETMDYELKFSQHAFKGKFDDLRIYSYTLNPENIINLYNSKLKFQTLKWNMPIGTHGFVEEVERVFKNKLTGNKSQFFNVKVKGLGIVDIDTRLIIEDIIKTSVKKVAPYYATLYKIIWIE